MTETPRDASEEATEDAIIANTNRPTAFADPLGGNTYEFDVTKAAGDGIIGFLNYSFSLILAPFHGSEYARDAYERMGVHVQDGAEKEYLARARFDNSDPLSADAPILELPENTGGVTVDSVYNEVDEIRASVLASRSARDTFGNVAAVPAEETAQPLPQEPSFDPNDLGPY